MQESPKSFRGILHERSGRNMEMVYEVGKERMTPIIEETWQLISEQMQKHDLDIGEALVLMHNLHMRIIELGLAGSDAAEQARIKTIALDTFEKAIKSAGRKGRQAVVMSQRQQAMS